ncbi:MAG TPA: S8 family serine peptidase [Actinomycetota bacterium]|nr:S8 family serine peptidase [Actinomycetota bacterium]
MKHRAGWLLTAVLVITGLAAGIGARPADASSAAVSGALASWLATAPADAGFKTIVTFHDRSGMSRLDALAANQDLSVLPMSFAVLSAAQINTVRGWPEVVSLWHDQENELILDESVALIGADKVHAGTKLKRGYTGLGVSVAVIDTGVDASHPDLTGRVAMFQVAGDAFDRDGVAVLAAPTADTYGHGTHVSSTINGSGAASAGRYQGVAPGSQVYSFKTDVGAFLLSSWALASFDWVLANPQAGIRVSSNSWGTMGPDDYDPANPINVTTKTMYDRGITVIFAAGNSGGPNTLNQYAKSPWVVSVAAGDKAGKLASFSSRGRIDDNWDRRTAQGTNTGIYRPTITAPGVSIEAAKSAQATLMATGTDPANPFYTTASGTSMAAPHVAGVAALMLQARPGLKPQHIIDILEGTATDMRSYELFEAGIGYLDAHAAVFAAEKGRVIFPPAVSGKTPTFTLASTTPFEGSVDTPNTWALARCKDDLGVLDHHLFEVAAGVGAIYAEIEWPSITALGETVTTDLLYLRIYAPDCTVVGESAALLDFGTVWFRSLVVTNPAPGTYTVGIYGRINTPTNYWGAFNTYVKN